MSIFTTVGDALTPEEVQELIDLVDKEKTGKVDYKQFVKLLCS